MQKPSAWALLLLVLGLDGVAVWVMLWQPNLRTALVCVACSAGLLLVSYRLWRSGSSL
jgi:hypothetical protein